MIGLLIISLGVNGQDIWCIWSWKLHLKYIDIYYSPLCTLPPVKFFLNNSMHYVMIISNDFSLIFGRKKFEACPLLRLSSLTSFGPNLTPWYYYIHQKLLTIHKLTMRLLFMRCPPFSSTMSKMLKNKWKMILIFPCMSNLFWTIFTLLWLCCFTLTSFSDLAHCACIYVRHQKKFLNWPTQMTISNYRWVLSKGLGTSCEFFFLCIFGKEWNYLSPKNIQWTSKKPPL